MNLKEYMNTRILTPKQFGAVTFIYNGNGSVTKKYSTEELGKAFFSMSNDVFFNIYGFNFVPEGVYWERSKRAARKM